MAFALATIAPTKSNQSAVLKASVFAYQKMARRAYKSAKMVYGMSRKSAAPRFATTVSAAQPNAPMATKPAQPKTEKPI